VTSILVSLSSFEGQLQLVCEESPLSDGNICSCLFPSKLAYFLGFILSEAILVGFLVYFERVFLRSISALENKNERFANRRCTRAENTLVRYLGSTNPLFIYHSILYNTFKEA